MVTFPSCPILFKWERVPVPCSVHILRLMVRNSDFMTCLGAWATPKSYMPRFLCCHDIPYSWKYWQALNLAVEPKIAIARILADLNLAVRYGIAIRIIICE